MRSSLVTLDNNDDSSTCCSLDDSFVQNVLFDYDDPDTDDSIAKSESVSNTLELEQVQVRISVNKLILNLGIYDAISRILNNLVGSNGRAVVSFYLQYQFPPSVTWEKGEKAKCREICQAHILPTLHLTGTTVTSATIERYIRFLKCRLPCSQNIAHSTEFSIAVDNDLEFIHDSFFIQLVMRYKPSIIGNRYNPYSSSKDREKTTNRYQEGKNIVIAFARIRCTGMVEGALASVKSAIKHCGAKGAMTKILKSDMDQNIGAVLIRIATITNPKHTTKVTRTFVVRSEMATRWGYLPSSLTNRNDPLDFSISSNGDLTATTGLIIHILNIKGLHSSNNQWSLLYTLLRQSTTKQERRYDKIAGSTKPHIIDLRVTGGQNQNQILIPFLDAILDDHTGDYDQGSVNKYSLCLEFRRLQKSECPNHVNSCSPQMNIMTALIPINVFIHHQTKSITLPDIKVVDLKMTSLEPIPVYASISLAAGTMSQVIIYPRFLISIIKVQSTWRSRKATRLQRAMYGFKTVGTCRNNGIYSIYMPNEIPTARILDLGIDVQEDGRSQENPFIDEQQDGIKTIQETCFLCTGEHSTCKCNDVKSMTEYCTCVGTKCNRIKNKVLNPKFDQLPRTGHVIETEENWMNGRPKHLSEENWPFHMVIRVGAVHGFRELLTLWTEHNSSKCLLDINDIHSLSDHSSWSMSTAIFFTFRIFSGISEFGWHMFSSRIRLVHDFMRSPDFNYQTNALCVFSDQFQRYLRMQSIHFTLWIIPSFSEDHDFDRTIDSEHEIPKSAIKVCHTYCPLISLLESSHDEYSEKCKWRLSLTESDDKEVIGNVAITIGRLNKYHDVGTYQEHQDAEPSFVKRSTDVCKFNRTEDCLSKQVDDSSHLKDYDDTDDKIEGLRESLNADSGTATSDTHDEKESLPEENIENVLASLQVVQENLSNLQRNELSVHGEVESSPSKKEQSDLRTTASSSATNNYSELNPLIELSKVSLSSVAASSIKSLNQVCQDLQILSSTFVDSFSTKISTKPNISRSPIDAFEREKCNRILPREESGPYDFSSHLWKHQGLLNSYKLDIDDDSDSSSSKESLKFRKPTINMTEYVDKKPWRSSAIKSYDIIDESRPNTYRFKYQSLMSTKLGDATRHSIMTSGKDHRVLYSKFPSPCSSPSSSSSASDQLTRKIPLVQRHTEIDLNADEKILNSHSGENSSIDVQSSTTVED